MNTQRTAPTKGVSVEDSQDRQALPDRNQTAGFMDTREAMQVHTMMRAAIDALAFDPEVLTKVVEEDRTPSGMDDRKRLDIRLVITVVVLLLIILTIDLLLYVFF